jgi:hypothetical protein
MTPWRLSQDDPADAEETWHGCGATDRDGDASAAGTETYGVPLFVAPGAAQSGSALLMGC